MTATPTLGATEVLASAVLATASDPVKRTHRLCLREVAVEAYSNPDQGADP